MKIAVIGAETAVGHDLRLVLGDRSPEVGVVAFATDPGAERLDRSGALAGVTAVVDIADAAAAPGDRGVRDTVLAATRRAVVAAERSGAGHFVLVSSAGLGRPAEDEHFTARLGAEAIVRASSVPSTIVRTTQLFESVRRLGDGGPRRERRRGRVVLQPIAARDVATEVAAIALDRPCRAVVALGGPDRFHLDELVERLGVARHHRGARVDARPAGEPGEVGVGERPGPLLGGTATLTATRFDEWLASIAARG